MISVNKFSYWYPGPVRAALRDVNLKIPDGQFCGIVGANGAGKSTLCYALTGFVPHFYQGDWDGDVEIDGNPIADSSLGKLAGDVGLVFQNPFNQISGARFTVEEEIAFGLENLGLSKQEMRSRITNALDLVEIQDLAHRSPFELSGGQQQRVAIASILAMRPKILVLDEPTSQLDPQSTQEVFAALRSLVRKGTATVVLAEHKLELLAEFADRVIALSAGRVVLDGEPTEVLSSPKLEKLGVGRTNYSRVATSLPRKGRKLPVTLPQARVFFR